MIAMVDREQCVSCGLCVDGCPEEAIVINEVAEIDQTKCTGCGTCIDECPNEAISLSEDTTNFQQEIRAT